MTRQEKNCLFMDLIEEYPEDVIEAIAEATEEGAY